MPHREARRQQRKQAFFAGIGFAAIVGAAIVLVWFTGVKSQIDNQEEHNQFLSAEIKRLDTQIADVATLKAEIAALKARQKAVEDLQADRNMPHLPCSSEAGQADRPRACTSRASSKRASK